MKSMHRILGFVVAEVLLASANAHAEDCGKFVVLDRYSATSAMRATKKVQDVVCKSLGGQGAAVAAATSAGVPFESLNEVLLLEPVGIKAASNWSGWKSQFCKADVNEIAKLMPIGFSERYAERAVRAVSLCMSSGSYGYFDLGPMGTQFTFVYQARGREKLDAAAVAPSEYLSECDPTNPFGLSLFERYVRGRDISSSQQKFGCSWRPNGPIAVRLSLAVQGVKEYTLPSLTLASAPLVATPASSPAISPPKPPTLSSESYVGNPQPSGRCGDFSGQYSFCTPEKPVGWTINYSLPNTIGLSGDRSCGGWSTCAVTERTPTRMCMSFSLQGHNEQCGMFSGGNTGIQHSRPVISVVWSHPSE